MTHEDCESKLHSVVRSGTHGRIHVQETGWQSGVQSCIGPGLPRYLVMELNAECIYLKVAIVQTFNSCTSRPYVTTAYVIITVYVILTACVIKKINCLCNNNRLRNKKLTACVTQPLA